MVEGSGVPTPGGRVTREELLDLQVGQQVRIWVAGGYSRRTKGTARVGLSSLDVRMLENLADLVFQQESVAVVRGQVRTIGRKGSLSVAAGPNRRCSINARDISHLEVLK
jgi:hypothetical protein